MSEDTDGANPATTQPQPHSRQPQADVHQPATNSGGPRWHSKPTADTPWTASLRPHPQGVIAGAAGAAMALGFGELVEGAIKSVPSLVVAVGELVAYYTPGDLVAASIANLGSSQKTVLTTGIVILSLVIGGMLGHFAARGQVQIAKIGFALFGVLGGWAAARNPFSPALGSWVVALTASALGIGTTLLLVSRIKAHTPQFQAQESILPAADTPLTLTTPAPTAADPDAADTITAADTAALKAADTEAEPVDLPAEDAESWRANLAAAFRSSTTADTEAERIADPTAQPARVGTRRSFFAYAGGAGATALAMVGIGRSLRGPSAAQQARENIVLAAAQPAAATSTTAAADTAAADTTDTDAAAATDTAAADTATDIAADAQSVMDQVAALDTLDGEVEGISTYISPNDGFYRIDTALTVPQVDPAKWSLRIGGMVDNPYELTYDEISKMDLSDHVITLSCVSNQVGGSLVGNAVWTGVPLAGLLDRAGIQPGADQVVGRSVDHWTAGFPTGVVHDGRNAILAIGMNGEPLPIRHGFPARLVVAGLYGYVSAVKWIEEITLTTWDGFDAYWVPRGWSKRGPMKTQSRIDVPAGDRGLVAGRPTPIAGIAWAPTRGIQRVEVQIDEEDWQTCRLGEALGDESWVQWHHEWTPTAGRHRIRVRATDGEGITQSSKKVKPRPNGAEGWHTINVNVST